MKPIIEQEIKNSLILKESMLSQYASLSSDGLRSIEDSDLRGSYSRDVDRIIHSLSYTRYIDKTQVFSVNNNDNISHRIVHVTLVSKIARTIGRFLNLNEDLIEAIALGHDIGHVPFGHVGENILNEISLKYGEGYFNHNVQSVRTYMFIENNGKGTNLCLQTLDGILCHNGEFISNHYEPIFKNWDIFIEEYNKTYKDRNILKTLIPMTLEGCVVRVSDIIGYIGRDIEDAINIGLIKREDIPKNITVVLGNNNQSIVNTLINDIVENSYNKPYLEFSSNVFKCLEQLKKFNIKNIYYKANTKDSINNYKVMFNTVFDKYLNDLNNKNMESNIYKIFLNNLDTLYIDNTTNERKVIDYISGMTDRYLIYEYNKISL